MVLVCIFFFTLKNFVVYAYACADLNYIHLFSFCYFAYMLTFIISQRDLESLPEYRSFPPTTHVDTDCEACSRRNHTATFEVT